MDFIGSGLECREEKSRKREAPGGPVINSPGARINCSEKGLR